MKKHYTIILLAGAFLFFSAGCSKDFLKPYHDRIEGGAWELYDVKSRGIGSRYTPAFTGGRFTFMSAGRLSYTDPAGNNYEGSWNIRREWNGSGNDDVHTLSITAVDFQTQDVLSDFFDDMRFTGTNKFRAFIYYRSRTYVFLFRR